MARKRLNVFSLSFLDVMSCGFGAVVLFFMIINHQSDVRSQQINKDLLSEVSRLQVEVLDGEEHLVEVKNSLEETEQEQVITQGLSKRIISNIEILRVELAELTETTVAREEHINALKADLQSADEAARRLEGSRASRDDQGDATRSFVGQGDRLYLTGMKVGGKRILILVDASTSMLDETIVNIIRRRNMSDADKLASAKWQRAVSTVDWITAQIPLGSEFQIYTFNSTPRTLLPESDGKWVAVGTGGRLNEAVAALREVIPNEGTSLENALAVINSLQPAPDNVYLLTDGLPTMGKTRPESGAVSGKARYRHFERAVRQVSGSIPINIVLFPMEGDPESSSAFWKLAMRTGGSFMSPADDWP